MPRTQSAPHSIIGTGSPDVIDLARNFMKLPPEQSGHLAERLASELVERAKTDTPFYLKALVASHGEGSDAAALAEVFAIEAARTGNERLALEGDCWHLLAALRRHTPSLRHLLDKMSAESMGQAVPTARVAPPPPPIVVEDDEVLEDPNAVEAAGRVVLPQIGDPSSKDGLDITRRYRSIIGNNVPYGGVMPQRGALADAIRKEWPWAEDVARFLEGRVAVMRQAHSAFVRLPPILLVGDTGSAKTTIARAIGDVLGLHSTLVACGGVSDSGGLAATPRGWTTSRPCAPFQSIATSRTANPLVVLDELDKGTPARSQNGSVWASALGILEQSDRYFDPCLQAEVDLSGVTYMATANHLDVMPPELTDRFLVLRVPRPRPQDFEIVLQGALKAEAKSLQTDVELLPELDRDDKAFLKDMFGQRRHSLRSFRKMVSLLIGEKAAVAEPHILH